MVKRGLTILLGASLYGGVACGKSFEGNNGGGGETPQSCTSTSDCSIPNDPCTTVSCQNNRCLYVKRPENVDLPDEHQIQGDCQTIVCIQGTSTTKPIPNDSPQGDACKSFQCINGAPQPEYAASGTPCGENGALSCDGNGNCGGCTETSQCGTPPACIAYDCNEAGICAETTLTNVDLDDTMPGDCLQPRCNEEGFPTHVNDDEDAPADQTAGDCLAPVCIAGNPEIEPIGDTLACTVPAAGSCCGAVCCTGTCSESMCTNLGGGGQGGSGGTGGGTNQGGGGGGV